MIWIKDKPRLDQAWYWWRPDNSTNDKAIPVFIDRLSDADKYVNGKWSHCPIPYPEESNIEDC